MAKLLKLRRGTTTQHASFTGAEGEVTIDTTKDTAVVHDGSTQAGTPLAKEDMSNVSSASIAGRLGTDSIAVGKIAAGTLPSDVKITDSNVSGNLSIASADINADAVNGTKIADNSIDSEHYVDGSIDNAHIASNAVTYSKMGDIGTNSIMGRISAGDGDPQTLTAANVRTIINVENGATADQTKSDIDALNINADTVDTLHASSFLRSDIDDVCDRRISFANNSNDNEDTIATSTGSQGGLEVYNSGSGNDAFMAFHAGSDFAMYFGLDADTNDLSVGGWSMGANKYRVWHEGNDGPSSGLNADTWDGYQFNDYLNQAVKTNSNVTFNTIHLDGSLSAVGAGAELGRNHAYNTLELKGYGAEFMFGSQHQDIHINYRSCNNGTTNHTPTTWYWRAGANNNWSNHNFGSVTANGSITATGNVTAYSDARLKTNVNTINDALSIVGKLRGVSFDWKESGKHSIGVIAQEVEEVLPEIVETTQENIGTKEEPKYREVKSVDYGKMVGVLINAINELKAEIEELKGGK